MDDADAFSELYSGEAESVLIFLTRRTFDAETAVELTAETFAIAMRSWSKLRGLACEQQRAWLFTVARRQLARNARRTRVERRAIERLGIEVPNVDHDDLLLIEQRTGLCELRVALGRELEQVSLEQRQALSLRVVEKRPYAEIVELLGSPRKRSARASRAGCAG